jgi:hypothetical protein
LSGADVVALFANADFWAAVLRIATPLIFGTLGALLSMLVATLFARYRVRFGR